MTCLKFCAGALALAFAARAAAVQPVTSGSALDYMPSVIRASDGTRIVVFERLTEVEPGAYSGALWTTHSSDGGATWSTSVAAIADIYNNRHPSLLQLGPDSYALFYLKEDDTGFRIWRATSSNGIAFAEQARLDLGWGSAGEVNPHVIRHADGTLTMSYQRNGGAYLTRSTDGGATWDMQRTQIVNRGVLPRIAYRESDGLYLASYQVNPGNGALQMFVKTTTDVRDWSGAAQDFAPSGNNHDSMPVVMPDGAFALFWIRADGSAFDVAARRSADGSTWGDTIAVTRTPAQDDVEPHPLVGTSADTVELYWGRDVPVGSMTYDIVREASVSIVVGDAIFADAFDGG